MDIAMSIFYKAEAWSLLPFNSSAIDVINILFHIIFIILFFKNSLAGCQCFNMEA